MTTAPTFWFAERGFENSRTPCICMDNPSGGDPLIIAQIEPGGFWPNYVNAMCDAATVCFRMADELSGYLAALNKIAEGTTPPERHGHYLAHREAVRVAREAIRRPETHIDRECRALGHEFAHEPDAEDGDPAICVHCGAEQ